MESGEGPLFSKIVIDIEDHLPRGQRAGRVASRDHDRLGYTRGVLASDRRGLVPRVHQTHEDSGVRQLQLALHGPTPKIGAMNVYIILALVLLHPIEGVKGS